MLKIFKTIPFLSAFLCLSVILFGLAVGREDWTWAFIWGVSIPLDLYELYKAVYIHGGKYKRIQSASAAYTAMAFFSVAAAAHNKGETALVLAWLILAVVNIALVWAQRRLFKRMVMSDQQFEDWIATNFPEDKMGDIKLERKR